MKVKEDLQSLEKVTWDENILVIINFFISGVKLCLESICLLLGEQTSDWKSIRQIIIRDNFIPTIINFQTDDISDYTRKIMMDK